MKTKWNYRTPGIPDKFFIRGKVPMTKEEVRAVTLSKLRLKSDDIIVDIGAGTGSISIECALIAEDGLVYAVERKEEGIKLIKENSQIFEIDNIEIIQGIAPEILKEVPKVDKVIVGGSGGKLKEIFQWLELSLVESGRLVMNFITLENMYRAIELLKENGFKDIDVTQLFVSKGRSIANLTMMEGHNPVYIISAVKE
ncbi:precorrin-6Y C5,15-methyltransferase (decarboxylating) subunit CbiT [Sporosalibacterium faouarense]|uniref:precorrin-6Y C5,15-methyltransferase (decarboxylating) subunit CbiT n=1 Tax=Sporosalibacterium faouarense TaxID=516123 RepID=UPI00141C04AC|nr:precorrin-6Y C5,15-methyltransferase (decarboxylating) subunit CbiT [Sporosalibacterium faouarense]MTI46560.1 precorrin-6Y C5,15-methyltransferase (decarboxylating) subunit CbiT [Bacillota bacterium]